jgi:ATP-dependent Clp protease ATP-binding subunit ClpC
MRQDLSKTLHEALRHAQQSAREFHQEYVGAEHLVLGMLAASASDANRAIRTAGDAPKFTSAIKRHLPRGADDLKVFGQLPLSPRTQTAINTAMINSRAAGEQTTSTRFVLAALLDDPESAIVQSIRSSGGDLDALKSALNQHSATPEP